MLGIAPESPASGARFVRRVLTDKNADWKIEPYPKSEIYATQLLFSLINHLLFQVNIGQTQTSYFPIQDSSHEEKNAFPNYV